MKENISIKEWQVRFANGEYTDKSFGTQCNAGWYDWFCKTESLRNKTYKMGRIIAKVQSGGKVDMDNWYVWFKNNCPMSGPLYDDFRFADSETGDIRFTIQIDCCWNKHKYSVYGRKPLSNGEWENHFEKPLFECDNSRELVKWLNKPWENENE